MFKIERSSLSILALLLTACTPWGGGTHLAQPNRFMPLSEKAPPLVGTVSRRFLDADRAAHERYPDDPADQREVMVQFWYPAESVEGFPLSPYLPDPAVAEVLGELNSWDMAAARELQSHSHMGAPLSGRQARYPVILFSHGLGGVRFQNTLQAEELAKHGYIVVGIDHTFGAAATAFPDGRLIKLSDRVDDDRRTRIWAADARCVLDELEKLDAAEAEGPFRQRLDLTRVGIFGHSAGGASAAQACWADPRFKAGLNMDGTAFGEAATAGLTQPFMVMSEEPLSIFTRRFFHGLGGPAYLLVLKGAGHMSFTDLPLLPFPRRVEGAGTAMDDRRALQIVSDFTLAFFDKHLNGTAAPMLQGPSREDPEVAFETR